MGLKHIIVLQNKIDLIHEDSARINYMDIRKFIQGTPAGSYIYYLSLLLTVLTPRDQSNYPYFGAVEIQH